MAKSKNVLAVFEPVEPLIRIIRGERIIFGRDLARLYGVSTKRLNEQVKRNRSRFPADFMFRLTGPEADESFGSRSQFATLKRGRNIKYLPYAFTEHGAIMAANVLNSRRAVEMSIHVIRAFVTLRREAGRYADLARKLAALERGQKLQGEDIQLIFTALRELEATTSWAYPKGLRLIGFRAGDRAGNKETK